MRRRTPRPLNLRPTLPLPLTVSHSSLPGYTDLAVRSGRSSWPPSPLCSFPSVPSRTLPIWSLTSSAVTS
ncbi:hypothetical protein Ahy_A05g025014 isoform A [Arachis hypogaea]|uniref:Uncharacterized protein n=1 Tax=Arachis hypogaea TaxID=3818 RepID=A0A445D7D8_ARAHY|nr:hypothetical protein Ahy_A05g025014 isoform A [Arachis hypogaea]